ncbi:S-type pyocin domain-containing protein [Pseudomonas sp. Root562]|uniref:S-type pyocin domain-containing protein n=1 Tax=Pseudomonas sp. Root562 TaxID=1736561 RepID=UPI000702669F|nr:S-type pyocin domain-containing protein [Pseudomonas sp. Root562]KQZ82552.1 colicin transporter [Pseudomonas sp. Root562]
MQKPPTRPNTSRPGYHEISRPVEIVGVAPDHFTPPQRAGNNLQAGPFGPNVSNYNQNRGTVINTTRALEQEYQVRLNQLAHTTESELSATRHEGPTDPLPPLQSTARELGVVSKLIERKTAQQHANTAAANSFYGGDPFNRHINEFMVRATKIEKWPGPNGIAMQMLNQSLRAAIEARLLAQSLQLLHQRAANLQQTYSVLQAAEQARVRAETEALAHAQELSRLAALAEAERAAAEQARIAAEAAAQYFAAEQARLEAEAELQRQNQQERIEKELRVERKAQEQKQQQALLNIQAEAQRQAEQAHEAKERKEVNAKKQAEGLARLNAMVAMFDSWEAAKTSRSFPVSGSAVTAGPVFTVAKGRLATNAATSLAIKTSLRTGTTAVMTAAATSASAVLIGFAALLFPSPLGDGESRQLNVPLRDLIPDDIHTWSLTFDEYEPDNLHAFSIPLSELTTVEIDGLLASAQANAEVELPVAIGSKTVGNTTEFFVAATNGTSVPGKVPVRLATYDPNLNVYTVDNPDAPSIGMTWTPIVNSANASTYFPASAPNTAVYDGTTLTALEGRTDSFPELDLYSFGGFITVFPADSGIPPIFTMFRDRRGEPGVANGYGEPLSGIWLGPASQGDGAVIPNQIADKLRGQNFPNFRAFREALWKAVASDPDVATQFRAHNIKAMINGKAPSAREDDHLGDKVKFELHHIKLISEGGAVYDIDNIRVVTPKRHAELHKKVKINEPR